MKLRVLFLSFFSLFLFGMAEPLSAHHLPPHLEEVDEFESDTAMQFALHPFSGVDHIFVAMAVGWLAMAVTSFRGVPAVGFLAMLMAGAVAGRLGSDVPVSSDVVWWISMAGGVALPLLRKSPAWLAFSGPALLGLLQGLAHGSAQPVRVAFAGDTMMYAMMLALGSAVLAGMGGLLARAFQAMRRETGMGGRLATATRAA